MTKYGPIMIPRVSPRNFYIDGHPAVVILADFETDIAVLATADYAVPSLKLAKAGPEYLAIITTAGYPYGLGPVINVGYVSNPSMEDPRAKAYMLMAIASCPGNSGGPILNSKNEVISVMQTSSGVGCAGVMGGAPYNDLVRVAGKYFSK
jgi:S1-C subfamily serine protease